ncbi:MAG: hypothetical protein ACE5HA_01500 [Anaerolineae bacterium]
MSNNGSPTNVVTELDQLERLIDYSPLIGGYRLISLAPIRRRQDGRMTDRICRRALRLIPDEELITLSDGNFFVGSVDFMIRSAPDGSRNYVVLETNGGSNRGYTTLTVPDLDRVCNGYLEMLSFIDDPTPLIVMGHPKPDPLLIEKLYLAQRIRDSLVSRGLCESARVVRLESFRGLLEPGEGVIILDGYDAVLPALVGAENKVILNGHPVDAIIGDGVARRHYQMGHGQRFDVSLANWSFPITDDKYLTYRAVEMAADRLAPFDVYPIKYWQAHTADELAEICAGQRTEGDLIIKPFQGSGGAGVHAIDERSPVPVVIEESIGEYQQKFGAWRSPFPYTICEKVEPHRAWWRESERNYDVRIYVARDGDQLLPVGGLFRIALEPHIGENRKRALVVNLSGYGGVDTERGLGISSDALETVRLEEEDMAKMFAASAVLMSFVDANCESVQRPPAS